MGCAVTVWRLHGKTDEASCKRRREVYLTMVVNEVLEFFVPCMFMLVVLIIWFSRNAGRVDGIRCEMDGKMYPPMATIADLRTALFNNSMFVLVDVASLVVSGIVLRCTCSVSLWKTILWISREFGPSFVLWQVWIAMLMWTFPTAWH